MGTRTNRKDAAQRTERYVEAVDLVHEARRCCLLAHLLVEKVVTIVGENRLDERLTVLVYASERSTSEALDALQLALVALK